MGRKDGSMAPSTEGSMLQVKLLGTISTARRNPLQEGDRDAKGSCGETELMQRSILTHERHMHIDSVFSFKYPVLKTV